MSAYVNPGKLFIDRYAPPTNLHALQGYFVQYADYLRTESGLFDPPYSLSAILDQFSIPARSADLKGEISGFTDSRLGITVNQSDVASRQRFTVAHELMEHLVDALAEHESYDHLHVALDGHAFTNKFKEALCDHGAAALLIPQSELANVLPTDAKLDLQTISDVASMFDVSLSAAACACVKWVSDPHAFVIWQMSNKPVELARVSGDQMVLGEELEFRAPMKLRIQTAFSNFDAGQTLFPRHKSVDPRSIIAVELGNVGIVSGKESVINGKQLVECQIEAMRVKWGASSSVYAIYSIK